MVEVGNFSPRLTKTQSPQIREKIQRKMMQRKTVFGLEGRREEKMVGFGNFSLGLSKLNFSKLGRKYEGKVGLLLTVLEKITPASMFNVWTLSFPAFYVFYLFIYVVSFVSLFINILLVLICFFYHKFWFFLKIIKKKKLFWVLYLFIYLFWCSFLLRKN